MMDLRGQNGPSLAFEMEFDGDDIEQNCVNDLPDPKKCIISLYTKKIRFPWTFENLHFLLFQEVLIYLFFISQNSRKLAK